MREALRRRLGVLAYVVLLGCGLVYVYVKDAALRMHLAEQLGELRSSIARESKTPVAGPLSAARHKDSNGHSYDVAIVDINKVSISFHLLDEAGAPLKTLLALKRFIEQDERLLLLATNAGMFHRDLQPVGLYRESSKDRTPLNLHSKAGNFGTLPNGVFAVTDTEVTVLETTQYKKWAPNAGVRFATQSGPMLLIDGRVHPDFSPTSQRRNIRSGVGVIDRSTVAFVISNEPVSLHEFAKFFELKLGCKNALYLDGAISQMYLPSLHRYELGGDFGPMIAVSVDAKE